MRFWIIGHSIQIQRFKPLQVVRRSDGCYVAIQKLLERRRDTETPGS